MDDPSTQGAEGFGLMFYNARWYDPLTGRMIQADSIVPNDMQGLDRYLYTANNPVRYTDPSGHDWTDCGNRVKTRCEIHMRKVKQAYEKWFEEAQQFLSMISGEQQSLPVWDPDNPSCGGVTNFGYCYSDDHTWVFFYLEGNYLAIPLAAIQQASSAENPYNPGTYLKLLANINNFISAANAWKNDWASWRAYGIGAIPAAFTAYATTAECVTTLGLVCGYTGIGLGGYYAALNEMRKLEEDAVTQWNSGVVNFQTLLNYCRTSSLHSYSRGPKNQWFPNDMNAQFCTFAF